MISYTICTHPALSTLTVPANEYELVDKYRAKERRGEREMHVVEEAKPCLSIKTIYVKRFSLFFRHRLAREILSFTDRTC